MGQIFHYKSENSKLTVALDIIYMMQQKLNGQSYALAEQLIIVNNKFDS